MSGEDPIEVDYHTNRWIGFGALAAMFTGVGLITQEVVFFLLAIIGIVYAGYAGLAEPPLVRSSTGEAVLSVERTFDTPDPDPDEEVEVTVEIRNVGSTWLPDIRFVDSVPTTLEVVDGTPRHGTALRPSGTDAFSYTVRVPRGEHRWKSAKIALVDAPGAIEREAVIPAETILECTYPPLERSPGNLPLAGLTTQYPGRIETEVGGEGIEFHGIREYQPGDPLSRVDWKRLAKSGTFATRLFREERLARVMLVIDTRRRAYRAPSPEAVNAVQRSVEAAQRFVVSLLDSGDLVGVTAFGLPGEECWLSPYSGDAHRARVRHALSTHPAFAPHPPETRLYERFLPDRRAELKRRRIRRLDTRLLPDTQVVLLSPCCDEYVPTIARQLTALGRPVTILSPDPTTSTTPLNRLARMAREDRLTELLDRGIPVIDWAAEEELATELHRIATGGRT